MKYTKIISLIALVAVFAVAIPASAESEASSWIKHFRSDRPQMMGGQEGDRPEGPRFEDGTSTNRMMGPNGIRPEGDMNGPERMMGPDASSTNPMMRPAVIGKVTAVDGSTFSIESIMGERGNNQNPQAVTFTVDASNAVVRKGDATSTVSGVAVGDYVLVLGTVSGNNIVAKVVIDGMPKNVGPKNDSKQSKEPKENRKKGDKSMSGDGQPVVLGTVASISGSSLTITNGDNAQFTVDASNAVVRKGDATSTVSAIVVGDNVVIQGVVSGSSITASTIIDRPAKNEDHASSTPREDSPRRPGFFGSVGGFFAHMFGF